MAGILPPQRVQNVLNEFTRTGATQPRKRTTAVRKPTKCFYLTAFHCVHFSHCNHIFNTQTKGTHAITHMYYFQTLCRVFRRLLLRNLLGEFYRMFTICIRLSSTWRRLFICVTTLSK